MTISRRGFIGSVGAAVSVGLLPSWLQFRQRKVIDLTPFCDDVPRRRYFMTQPFAQDGMVYATDGRIAVRTMLADVPELSAEVKLPPASTLPAWKEEPRIWQPWPKRRLIVSAKTRWPDSTCPECSGYGGVGNRRRCANCDGSGSIPGDGYNFISDCTCCRGIGWLTDLKCDYCDGIGLVRDKPSDQPIGSLRIAGHYEARVRSLGDVEYCITSPVIYGWSAVKFRGDGFEGLLMPLEVPNA